MFGRLIYRTLTFVDDTPGQKLQIKPDLAESLGKPSADKKTWTYKLRSGLKFEDGSPITSKDIKYGVERSFATDIYKDGATYLTDLLANPKRLRRSVQEPNKDLSVRANPGRQHDRVHSTRRPARLGLDPGAVLHAPVPKAKDDKQNYDFHPVSSGPYKISSYTRTSRSRWSATPTGIRRPTRTARRCRTASSRPLASTCPRSASG
jgi:peptide/nickel transport system substrate-binding protein